LQTIGEGAKSLAGTSLGTISKNISGLAKALDEYAKANERIKAAVGGSFGGAAQMLGTANTGVQQAEAAGVGKDVTGGMVVGMENGKQEVVRAAVVMADAIIAAAKQALGIASPSKEFMVIGEYIVEGMIEGINARRTEIQTVMADLAKSLTGATKQVVTATGDWRGSMSGMYGGKSGGQKADTTAIDAMRQLADAVSGVGDLSGFASGLMGISEAIESGAKSYNTLGRLATSIEKVKIALNGFKIPSFDKLIELARALQENYNAETNLKKLAEGMEAIKAASAGFKMPNTKDLEKIVQTINSTMVSGVSKGAVTEANSAMQYVSERVQEGIDNGTQRLDFSQFDPAKLPLGALGMTISEQSQQMAQYGDMVKDTTDALVAMGAIDMATTSGTPAKPSLDETQGVLDKIASNTQVEKVNGDIEETKGLFQSVESRVEAVNDAVRQEKTNVESVNESLEEGLRIRQEMMAAADQKRLEDNYSAYRELFLSKEGNWEQQVPEMYGFTPKAIEEGETYADAFRITMEEVNRYVDEFIEKTNTPEGTLLRDSIDSANEAKLAFKNAQESAEVLKNVQETLNVSSGMQQVASSTKAMASTMEQSKTATRVLTDNMKDLDRELRSKKKDTDAVKESFLGLRETFSGLVKVFKTTAIGRLAIQFKNLAKRMAIRALIRQITSAFKEGIENVYRYNEAIGGTFSKDMDSASTSLYQMKNALGAALAPAIQMLIPYLNQLVQGFINVLNYVNQFLSLLNGKNTWTRALPYATKAYEDQKKNAKQAHENMKDLLADWDELNIIQSQNNGGNGSSSGSDTKDYKAMFEEVSVFDSGLKDIIGHVKDVFDFAKEHFGEILAIVTAIRWGARLAKFSTAFAGILGNILGLVGTGFVIKLTIDAVSTLDKKFLETGNTGYLLGDLLVTLLGGVLAKKILATVLGGTLAKIAIPLMFAVSAVTTVVALVQDTDVSALSEEGLLSAANAALKYGGAAGGLLYSLVGTTAGMATGYGFAKALFVFGATIGIKATADVIDGREITGETILADWIAANAIGAGLLLSEAIIAGTLTAGTIATAGLGALFVFGALIAIQAVIASSPKTISWGNYKATKEEIQTFVEGEVFDVTVDTALNLIDPIVQVSTTSGNELKAEVDKARLFVKKIEVGFNSNDVLKDLEKQVFGDEESGTVGLIGQFRQTAKDYNSVIETGLTLVPTTDADDEKSTKKIIDTTSDAWAKLFAHMDTLGAELSRHLSNAYKEGISEEARSMELKSIDEITTMMANVAAAITQGEQWETGMQTLEANIRNLDKSAWIDMFKYIEEYKTNLVKTYSDTYDQTTAAIAGQMRGLEQAMNDALVLADGNQNDATYIAYKEEYERVKAILEARRAGRDDAIELAATNSMDTETIKRVHDAFVSLFEFDKLDENTLIEMSPGGFDYFEALVKNVTNPDNLGESKKLMSEALEDLIASLVGAENWEAIQKAMEAGIVTYKDFFGDAAINALIGMVDTAGVGEEAKDMWTNMINELLRPETIREAAKAATDARDKASDVIAETANETVNAATDNIESVKENYAVQQVEQQTQEVYDNVKELTDKTNTLTLDDLTFDATNACISANDAASAFEDMAKRIRNAFRSLDGMSYEMNVNGQTFTGAMNVLVPVQQKAMGGFVKSGDLVMANENGNFEMMGKMGNQPVVANNQQIVNGITQGVSQANGGVESRLNTIETILMKMLSKEFVAKVVPSSSMGRNNQMSAEAYDRVRG